MKLFLPNRNGLARSFVFDRSGRDFSERDRGMVDLLQPHFLHLEESARARRLAAALAAGAEAAGELVVLDKANRIAFATARAQLLLCRYAPEARGARLPPLVDAWLRDERERANGKPFPAAGRPMTIERGLLRLVVRRVGENEDALILDEEGAAPQGSGVLTRREHEIMALVREGASNAEIAATLQIAQATVRTHLENIYAKLGVRRRTAAVARLRQLDRAESE